MFRHVLKEGKGPPLLFLHGFLGCGLDWNLTVQRLGDHTCIAYDLPGHGNSPWTTEALEFPEEPFHLIGYSLGGRLAMRFALKHPERILSLTLLSAHYGLATESEKQNRLQSDEIWAHKLRTLSFDEFLREWYAQAIFTSFVMRRTKQPEALAQALLHWSLAHQPYYREELLAFPRPLFIFYGALDTKFKALYQNWSQATEIPNKGHNLL